MTDLTKIITPFGFLDKETQEALKSCGTVEVLWGDGTWSTLKNPAWLFNHVYRKKPGPRKPRRLWVNRYADDRNYLHTSKESAISASSGAIYHVERIHVIEWPEDAELPDLPEGEE